MVNLNKQYRILVLFNDEKQSKIIRQSILESTSNCSVKNIKSSRNIVSVLRKKEYNVILLSDKNLNKDVTEICEKLKDNNITVPIVYFSEQNREKEIVNALNSGACNYLIIDEDGTYLKLLLSVIRIVLKSDEDKRASELFSRVLKKNSEKYQNIFNNIQDVYYERDMNGKIIELSPSVSEISKFSRNDLLGSDLKALYYFPEEEEKIKNEFLVKGGKIRDYVAVLRDKDDAPINCSVNASIIYDENGVPEKVVGALRNVNKTVYAEERLSERLKMSELNKNINIVLARGDKIVSTLDKCVNILENHLNLIKAKIWSVGDKNALDFVACSASESCGRVENCDCDLKNTLIGEIIETKRAIMVNNIDKGGIICDESVIDVHKKLSFFGTPLIIDDEVIGIMILLSKEPFKDYFYYSLSGIGIQIGLGLKRKFVEYERELLINDLKIALNEVKKLSGLLPICASCKKIRDDKGYWQQVETFIRDRSDANFSHGICPDCAVELYPEYFSDEETDDLKE